MWLTSQSLKLHMCDLVMPKQLPRQLDTAELVAMPVVHRLLMGKIASVRDSKCQGSSICIHHIYGSDALNVE